MAGSARPRPPRHRDLVVHRGCFGPNYLPFGPQLFESLGVLMLNRLTISALLKSVIAVMAACVVAFLITTAWDSWGRLQSAGRMSVIAEVSENAFKAMHNLRTDRANTTQTLNGEAVIDSTTEKAIRDYRDTENPAMKSAADLSAAVDFADKTTLLPNLIRQMEALKALQAESWDAMSKPKASRRPALAKEYAEAASALLQTLDKLSTQLAAAVAHTDPVIDQLLAIKQLAWLVRDTGGQAALLLSNGLAV